MEWNKGFSAEYHLAVVDGSSWRDLESVEIVGGSIERSEEGTLQSATIEVKTLPDAGDSKDEQYIKEKWVRVYMVAKQEGGSAERVPIFTGLTSTPQREFEGERITYEMECYSVLKPAEDVLLERGYYAPTGMSGAVLAAQLLDVCPAPIEYADNAPKLTSSIVAEDGETKLSMAQKIVEAMDWRIKITGDGKISIEPAATALSATFDALENDVIEPSITDSFEWYECPNVFRAIMDDTVAVARDDDPSSVLSTVSRGREVWAEEDSVELADGELLASYAARRLKEEQAPAHTVGYDRRFYPSVTVGDIVRLHLPSHNIDGTFKISSQSIELGHGARTTEEVSEYEL